MTKVSVSFVANLSDLPALFSTLGASLSLCQDLKVESITEITTISQKPSPIDLGGLVGVAQSAAQQEQRLNASTQPKAAGLTRSHDGSKERRIDRKSERDYRRSRVQTLIYTRLVEAGYNTPVPYPVLEQVLTDAGYAPKSLSPGLTLLFKQGMIARGNHTARALPPVGTTPSADEPELPMEGTKSDG